MFSALLVDGVPIECINQAAITYHVPATLIISVLTVENGKVGHATKNKNGTFDYGPMQINSIWLDKLKTTYSLEEIRDNPCTNVWVGTWILSQRIAKTPDFWYGVGSYNSYSLPLNYRYQSKVSEKHNKLVAWLSDSQAFSSK